MNGKGFLLGMVFLLWSILVLTGCKPSNYEKAECAFDVPSGVDIECGYLTVPEDRSQKNSPMIRLHVAIVRTEDAKPDPVVLLQGGPGANSLGFMRCTPVLDAERLRKDVNRRSDTLRIIMERRNTTPPVRELLRELTRLTPDEAWAGQIEIRNGRLRITGEASAGSELMQALTTSSHFSDPRFEAPLTQNPKSGRERFVISLAIKERVDER